MQSNKQGFAPLIIILIIAIIIAVAVLAFNYLGVNKSGKSSQTVNSDAQLNELNTLGVSDEVSAIETDLNKTNLEKINQELPQVDQEAEKGL
ncbi:hypothetical protein A2870_04355 [Candidatus Curtissbacteria bacterium RIFCSPHIGHO2_01_FULL_41_11]|uniref:Uncharacterized protein n=1 Tax=Candidatus Curtissbacteria bacterium RIFCSPHIGHO2_01_FULL_41_11 TaxID=1797711 RepID=A0A1F5G590_9BACT|nr:MAG: hypothetical protein A2870_04355 [Candidatus Curtissbacteria bacterium RIFCSPHIGHO2_01_FULL_41_11]